MVWVCSVRVVEPWKDGYAIESACGLHLHQLHRAAAFAPRTGKNVSEDELFARRRDLFSNFGHSKDHRPDLKQKVVGMMLDLAARPA